MRRRRYFRTMPPGAVEVEMTEVARSLSLHDLELALAVLNRELDYRTGKQKFQIPEHIARMLN